MDVVTGSKCGPPSVCQPPSGAEAERVTPGDGPGMRHDTFAVLVL